MHAEVVVLTCCLWLSVQARLRQQLHNAEATEQLLKSELAGAQQQLQQAVQEAQRVAADARAAADAAAAQHQAELQQLQHQLGDEGASQVGRGQANQLLMQLSCCSVCGTPLAVKKEHMSQPELLGVLSAAAPSSPEPASSHIGSGISTAASGAQSSTRG